MKSRKGIKITIASILLLTAIILFIKLTTPHSKELTENIINDGEVIATQNKKDTVKLWKEDILFLNQELEKRHKNMYHSISKEDYKKETDLLLKDLSNLSDIGKLIRIKSLVAKVGDGHTCIIENFPPHIFPLQLFTFEDGIYVIKTIEEYKNILGTKLIKIGDEPIQNIMNTMTNMIARDNDIHLNNSLLQYIVHGDILHEYGYIDDVNKGTFVFETSTGEKISLQLNSLFNRYDGKWCRIEDQKDVANMKYMKNSKENYWYEYLPEENLVYFQYNICRSSQEKPIEDFTKELLDFLDKNHVQKLIFDMRLNEGGSSPIIEPLIDGIAKNKIINQKGNLYVVIGRNTFSSAVLNTIKLKEETNAILIGEATGGKPNHFGEVDKFNLPNTGLIVRYATKYFAHSKIDSDAIYPDIPITYSFDNFIKGIDPVLKKVLSDATETYSTKK